MKIIGITGGIGCGKSELMALFDNRDGVSVCCADQIGRELQQRDGAAYGPIVEAFGTAYCRPDGELDRQALARLVFDDPEALDTLNAIVHPLVHQEVLARIEEARARQEQLFLVESAILLDVGYQDFCDEAWCLRASYENRLRRLAAQRGMSEEEIERIISRQRSDEEFVAACDQVIVNDGSTEELRQAVNGQLRRLGLELQV